MLHIVYETALYGIFLEHLNFESVKYFVLFVFIFSIQSSECKIRLTGESKHQTTLLKIDNIKPVGSPQKLQSPNTAL